MSHDQKQTHTDAGAPVLFCSLLPLVVESEEGSEDGAEPTGVTSRWPFSVRYIFSLAPPTENVFLRLKRLNHSRFTSADEVLDKRTKHGFSSPPPAESWEEFYLEPLVCGLQLPLRVAQ